MQFWNSLDSLSEFLSHGCYQVQKDENDNNPKLLLSLSFYSFESFSHHCKPVVFNRNLCDRKSPQVSRTLLSILADLNTAVVWMVSSQPLISKSTSPFVTVLNAPITIGITVTFMFHIFFSSLARSRYLSIVLLSFSFTLWSSGIATTFIRQVPFFVVTIVV